MLPQHMRSHGRSSARLARTCTVIGGGRVGRTLGRLLAQHGWRIRAVITTSTASARAASRAIGQGRPLDRVEPEIFDVRLLLIAVPDRAVAAVARALARRAPPSLQGRVVLHTSGALGSRVLAPLAERGASVGSLHPLHTFALEAKDSLQGVLFAIEGQTQAVRLAQRLARSLGGIPVRIGEDNRSLYHAAATMAAPHLLALVEAAAAMFQQAGLNRRQAVSGALHLARQTLDNYERLGPQGAWTGPVARGDWPTIRRHLAALKRLPGGYASAYRALTTLEQQVLGDQRPRGSERR